MTTAVATYRCVLDGGLAGGLVVPDVEWPAPTVIECGRRDCPGWALYYQRHHVDADNGLIRYRFVGSGPADRPEEVLAAVREEQQANAPVHTSG